MGVSAANIRTGRKDAPRGDLAPLRQMVQACIQCGTCSGSCPNVFAMDHSPRQLWRMLIMEREDEIFQSKTFSLCSACYYCTLRCPRGLALTEAMDGLKQAAAWRGLAQHRVTTLFYEKFIESVRRHGRVREVEFMTLYFSALKSPLLPFRFASLGIRLMAKKKVSLQFPSKGRRPLAALFSKVEELEAGP